MMRTHTLLRTATLLITALWMAPSAFAGDLTPPGPPKEGTMKPLDQVEPRIPITRADIPLAINTPGSYYLTENLTLSAGGKAITVNVDNVTIDLAGFTITGPDNGLSYGIYMYERNNIEIRNGTVQYFMHGIFESTMGQGHRIIDVRVLHNSYNGIALSGTGHLVQNCTAAFNGRKGISACGTITNNSVFENGRAAPVYVYGIYAPSGSTVTGNTVCNNGTEATISVYGIYALDGSTVTGNTVKDNGTLAAGLSVCGISATDGCVIRDNTVSRNGYQADTATVTGLFCGDGSVVIGNAVQDNGDEAAGNVKGINLYRNNLVDQNVACRNGVGAASAVNMEMNVYGCVYGSNVAP